MHGWMKMSGYFAEILVKNQILGGVKTKSGTENRLHKKLLKNREYCRYISEISALGR